MEELPCVIIHLERLLLRLLRGSRLDLGDRLITAPAARGDPSGFPYFPGTWSPRRLQKFWSASSALPPATGDLQLKGLFVDRHGWHMDATSG